MLLSVGSFRLWVCDCGFGVLILFCLVVVDYQV